MLLAIKKAQDGVKKGQGKSNRPGALIKFPGSLVIFGYLCYYAAKGFP